MNLVLMELCRHMMMLQNYQFEHIDCSHISCHEDVGISLAKKYNHFKLAPLGHWQEGPSHNSSGWGSYHKDRYRTRIATYCSWPFPTVPRSMLDVWTSIIVIYRLVYELLLLSYCYTFVWCLMKCVPEYNLDWIFDEMSAWILSCPAAIGELTSAHLLLL
jgi:hypothetical protein